MVVPVLQAALFMQECTMASDVFIRPGFEQYDSRILGIQAIGDTQAFSIPIAAQSLAPSGYYSTNQTFPIIAVDKALMNLRIQFSGLESEWRPIRGDSSFDFDDSGESYQVRIQYEATGSNLKVYVVVYNVDSTPITTPAFTVNGAIKFYLPPW